MSNINNIVLNGTKYDIVDKNSSDRLDKIEEVIVPPADDDTAKAVTIQGGAIKFVDKEIGENGEYTGKIKSAFLTSAKQLSTVINQALMWNPGCKFVADRSTVCLKGSTINSSYEHSSYIPIVTSNTAGILTGQLFNVMFSRAIGSDTAKGEIFPIISSTSSSPGSSDSSLFGPAVSVMMPALATDEQPINPCTHIYSDTLQVDGVSVSYQPEQKFAYLPASTGLDEGYYIVTANVAKPTATGMTYESFHVLQRDGQRFKFLKTIEWADAPIEIKNLFGVGSISINAINQDE